MVFMTGRYFFKKIDVKTRWNFLNWVGQSQFLHRKLLFYMAISLLMHLKPMPRKVTATCADKLLNGIIQPAKTH